MSQPDFKVALLDASRPVPPGLTDARGRVAGARFNVYRNNVATSLGEALQTGFPATAALLGETNFKTLAQGYLRSNPPSSPLMLLYGGRFPRYLANIPALKKMGYLPDVARLEYALRQSYHAADAAEIPTERLADLAPTDLNNAVLIFAPATRLVASDFPILAIRAKALGTHPEALPGVAQPCLITRRDFDPEAQAITEAQAALIATLMQGTKLLTASLSHPDADLGQCLALLLSRGALTDIRTDASKESQT